MSNKISRDLSKLDPGAIIELFELDMSTGSADNTVDKVRWYSGSNEVNQEIVWQGNIYSAYPVEASGFEMTAQGKIPRPKLLLANITSIITPLVVDYDDLVGSKITRRKTFAKHLDSYCIIGGSTLGGWCTSESGGAPYSQSRDDCLDANKNGSAGYWYKYDASYCSSDDGTWYENRLEDDLAHFADEVWYVDRKVTEANTHVEFELTAAYDLQGIKIPSRFLISNTCVWLYKGAECTYGSTSYWDINNNPVADSADDICAKTFEACELRFPEPNASPFGGFPGAGRKL